MSNFLHRINPFYKFVVVAGLATGLTFVHSFVINMWIFAITVFLFLLGTKLDTWWRAVKISIPLILVGFSIFMSGAIWGGDETARFGTVTVSSAQSGLNMLSRFFSFTGFGLLLSLTTDSFDLVKAMQKNGKLPRKFAYGMMAAINMIPLMISEYRNARLAFAVRGASAGPLSPKVLFAMLVNCFRWSEMLATAMHSRGFHED